MPSIGNELSHILDGATIRGGLGLEGAAGITTYLNRDAASYTARTVVVTRSCGYFAETSAWACCSGSALASTGILYGMGVGLLAGEVVSTIVVALQTIGVSVTLAKAGLYSKTGALLASSADAAATMNGTTGMKPLAMSTPYAIPADDLYYAAFLAIGAGTQPTLMQAKGAVNAFQAIGTGGIPMQASQTGQTDLPASATLVGASSTRTFWLGIS